LTATIYKKYLEVSKREHTRVIQIKILVEKKDDYSLSELLLCGDCGSILTTGTNKYTKHYRCKN